VRDSHYAIFATKIVTPTGVTNDKACMSDPRSPDPAQLRNWLHGAAQRDAAAFRQLYDATSARLYGFALRILGRRELAEEALQDGYIAIWNGAAGYQSHLAAPMTWMTTIVRNKAFDLLQRTGRDAALDAEQFDAKVMEALRDPGATPIETLALSREARTLAYCMSALDGLHRQVLGLAFFHDLSHTEVAQQMALPIGTVKTWIRRSLDKLKTCLAKGERR
jgi:RNA polymerase sigma factor (sigma-70 family)